jgi:hypothetical protein
MNAQLKTILDDLAAAATKVKTIVNAAAGSPITAEAEKAIPGLSSVVASVVSDAAILGALGAAIPALETVIGLYEAAGGKPMDANDMARIDKEKTGEFPG